MRVLIADDNAYCCDFLKAVVEQMNGEADIALTGAAAKAAIARKQYDFLLLDLVMPDTDGFELLKHVKQASAETKVILISGCIGVNETVRAMQLGACSCIAKPFKIEEVRDILLKFLPAKSAAAESNMDMVAVSQPMRETKRMISRVSKSHATTVLITGETGTGKEVIAQHVHKASDRRERPFVAVNCSAIPASLIESELFGHEKGAFTDARATRKGHFEAAGEGTVFLDEIGDMSMELQSKLLRVLQERSYRRVGGTEEIPLKARIIAATNVDLATAVQAGKFREDLYYRLAVIPIHLRPLRERTEDILPLAERFIRHFASEINSLAPELSPEHMCTLIAYNWPGNVRELRNVIERYVLMGGLQFFAAARPLAPKVTADANSLKQFDESAVAESERKMIYEFLLHKLVAPNKERVLAS